MVAALAMVLTGCATAPVLDDTYVRAAYVSEHCLPGIQANKTTRAEILARLGPPTTTLSDGRVLAYRLLLTDSESVPMTVDTYQYRMGRDRSALGRADSSPWTSRDPHPGGTLKHNFRRRQLSEICTLVAVTPAVAAQRAIDLIGREAEYALVLSFDDGAVLKDLSFRRVWP